ncbi:MAG: transcriptional repressor [Planctomycetota bacterium]|nr:transcriptional repressor [Planctomycetota bacterium]
MNKKDDNKRRIPLRMTRQRRVILEELRKVTSHPTADAVYGMVRRRLPNISLGTVYRNLEILSETGMIQKLELGGSARRYDGNPKIHYHIRCVRCGQVSDLPVGTLSALDRAIRKGFGYEILGYRLEFVGLCPKCKKAKNNK